MTYTPWGLALLLASAFLALAVGRRARWPARVAAVGAVLGGAGVLLDALQVLMAGAPLSWVVSLGRPFGTVVFALDPLSACFALLISVGGAAAAVYGVGYTGGRRGAPGREGPHFFFFNLLLASMVAVVLSRHAVAFLVSWELMTLTSFFCILYEDEQGAVRKAAVNYLVAMQVGAFCLVAGFILLASKTGSYELAQAGAGAVASLPLAALFFIGFGIKAGFVPFHGWLPEAHPAAPSHVSSLLSGVMIKTGLYGMFRTVTWLGVPPQGFCWALFGLSLAAMLFAISSALTQRELKRMLAYSSIENMGLMGLAFSLGLLALHWQEPALAALAFAASLLHVLNHSLFKGLLFFSAGAVYRMTHTRVFDELGGLGSRMPTTAATALVACLGAAGLPLSGAFASELLIAVSLLRAVEGAALALPLLFILALVLFAFTGGLVFLGFTAYYGMTFQGNPRSPAAAQAQEVPWSMRAPMLLLAVLSLAAGLFPQALLGLLYAPSACLTAVATAADPQVERLLSVVSAAVGAVLALTLLLYLFRRLLLRRRTVARAETWSCGYTAPDASMQYTAGSYVMPLLSSFRGMVGLRHDIRAPRGLFPERASYTARGFDTFRRWVTGPVTVQLSRMARRFAWIQSGSIRQYVLYGVLFLAGAVVVALSWSW